MVAPNEAEARKPSPKDAQALLASLRVGDKVVVDAGHGDAEMTVVRESHHPDGTGAWESYGIYANVRPGGYSVSVSVAGLAGGYMRLRLANAAEP